jgi:hypothetical protein
MVSGEIERQILELWGASAALGHRFPIAWGWERAAGLGHRHFASLKPQHLVS